MEIKYHEYGHGYDYGEDGRLTNNWNPDLDYGSEYVKVHININTPTYDFNSGFVSNEARDQWNEEVSNLIRSFGIKEDSGFYAETEKCAYLYAHPQQISGIILKKDVKKVAETINGMHLSSVCWVDLRQTVYDISDEDYALYLDEKKAEIRKLLFDLSRTTRTYNYWSAVSVAISIAKKVRLYRLGELNGINQGNGQTIEYVLKVAREMIEEGYLKHFERDGNLFIRSLNKTEQKKIKLCACF